MVYERQSAESDNWTNHARPNCTETPNWSFTNFNRNASVLPNQVKQRRSNSSCKTAPPKPEQKALHRPTARHNLIEKFNYKIK